MAEQAFLTHLSLLLISCLDGTYGRQCLQVNIILWPGSLICCSNCVWHSGVTQEVQKARGDWYDVPLFFSVANMCEPVRYSLQSWGTEVSMHSLFWYRGIWILRHTAATMREGLNVIMISILHWWRDCHWVLRRKKPWRQNKAGWTLSS